MTDTDAPDIADAGVLPLDGMASIIIDADGEPIPQGSMTIGYTKDGRAFIRQSNPTPLKKWRAEIAKRAQARCILQGWHIVDGPVAVAIDFYQERVKAAAKRPHPHTTADVDKLARAVLDALTGIVFTNDARVVDLHPRKLYPTLPGTGPGCRITVHAL